ncbi:hypothetical protein TREAZ_3046 [Leadbettera azotonutricia ZAS-9]|uniref:Uncharacterized protein n=1 Tax=Leadbettera azotonutricia (strain ATCC BAA-888 / DSM 13862 / ZAS-9) TaxID=545695 RepID=F5YB23_LEAAZ|nr:hypothetical protein TREAZ_3046 [Leadbettera azotonutricia ZAS-9]
MLIKDRALGGILRILRAMSLNLPIVQYTLNNIRSILSISRSAGSISQKKIA